MFAYGQLSDLKDGRLVTPIKKVGGIIECIMQDGSAQSFSFDDFDFDKTITERIEIEIDSSSEEDSSFEEIVKEVLNIELEKTQYKFKYNNFTFFIKNKENKKFGWIKDEDKLIFSERIII